MINRYDCLSSRTGNRVGSIHYIYLYNSEHFTSRNVHGGIFFSVCDWQAVERWLRGSEAVPSLYVFECVELELTLKLPAGEEEEPVESDFTCPIRLHRGEWVMLICWYSLMLKCGSIDTSHHVSKVHTPSLCLSKVLSMWFSFCGVSFVSLKPALCQISDPLCQHRYHCTHEAGVHSVGLTWFNKLHKFLQSGESFMSRWGCQFNCVVYHINQRWLVHPFACFAIMLFLHRWGQG